MTDFGALFKALAGSDVRFVLVGGVAATLHGSARLTQDVDIVYARDPENLARIARALAPLHPYLRGVPAGLPFRLDEQTLAAGLNFTLTTSAGDIGCMCIDLPTLIAAKLAAGRPKDLEALAELRALLQERNEEE